MCVLFEFRQVFFYSGNSSTYFKVLCRSLQRISDHTRCLAVSILEYNLGPKMTGSEVQYKLEYEVGRASESVLVF